jgi:hypothetical protein
VLAHVLWLQITLFPHRPAAAFNARLRVWAASRGLLPVITTSGVAVLAIGRLLESRNRGVLLGWLIEQPDVACARVEQGAMRLAPSSIEQEDRHGQA